MFYIIEEVVCNECHGDGRIYDPQCTRCGRHYTYLELANVSFNNCLPCGHQWKYLEEEPLCTQCGGEGKITHRVPLDEAWGRLRPPENNGMIPYALSLCCRYRNEYGFKQQVAWVWARSKEEAIGMGFDSIHKTFPRKEGHHHHNVLAMAIEDKSNVY